MSATLYVGNLPFSSTEEEIRQLFEENSFEVVEIRLINDRETGRPRGFGFVQLQSEEAAQKAAETLADKDLGGRRLTVSIARDR